MKYFILIMLILTCTKWMIEFSRDTQAKNKAGYTFVIMILHIIAAIGYFNLMFITK